MALIIGKIDVTKIEKQLLFKGAKGTYLDIALIPTPDSEYGDYMIVQSLPKERREAGEKGEILGNAKIRGGESRQSEKPRPQRESKGSYRRDEEDERETGRIPF